MISNLKTTPIEVFGQRPKNGDFVPPVVRIMVDVLNTHGRVLDEVAFNTAGLPKYE